MTTWKTIGQDHLIQALGRSLQQDRLSHAYLLVGPPQVGKMTLAIDLARAVNCLDEQKRPCGACRQCQRIDGGNHADVQVVGVETDERTERLRAEITIDQVRALEQAATLKPYEGAYRVFIIDGAERLNLYAANALLKTVEEPPPQVLLLLLTSNEEAVPLTLRSRCQRLELRPLSLEAVTELLINEQSLSQERAQLLGRLSGGRLGWTLAATADTAVMEERAHQLQRLQEVVDGGLEVRFEYARELAAQYGRSRETVRQVLGLWLQWWRDLLVLREGSQELVVNLDYLGADHDGALQMMAHRFQAGEVAGMVSELLATMERLEQNANPRLALDVLMLALPTAAVAAS